MVCKQNKLRKKREKRIHNKENLEERNGEAKREIDSKKLLVVMNLFTVQHATSSALKRKS